MQPSSYPTSKPSTKPTQHPTKKTVNVLQGLAALPATYQAGIGIGIFIFAAMCIVVSIIAARMLGYDFSFGKKKRSAYDEWNEWYDQRSRNEGASDPDAAQMTKEERLEKVRSQFLASRDPHNPAPLRKTFVNPELQMVDMAPGAPKRLDVAGLLGNFSLPKSSGSPEKPAAFQFDGRGSNAGLDEVNINDLYSRDRSLTQVIQDLKDQQAYQAAVLAALENQLDSSAAQGEPGMPAQALRPHSAPITRQGKSDSVFGAFNPLIVGATGKPGPPPGAPAYATGGIKDGTFVLQTKERNCSHKTCL
jgi:hypothetical protein